mmetsp:Transcript_1536/g.3518  ORF Transcript_1536/g.3518 Transcript_1536/m.3518 type:complete len:121 (-) Transcript_1536:188-550(-)
MERWHWNISRSSIRKLKTWNFKWPMAIQKRFSCLSYSCPTFVISIHSCQSPLVHCTQDDELHELHIERARMQKKLKQELLFRARLNQEAEDLKKKLDQSKHAAAQLWLFSGKMELEVSGV